MANFKRIVRSLLPPVIRRRLQRWRIDRAVRGFDRRVVRHRYGGVDLAVEIADPVGACWYDYDWVFVLELDLLERYGCALGRGCSTSARTRAWWACSSGTASALAGKWSSSNRTRTISRSAGGMPS